MGRPAMALGRPALGHRLARPLGVRE
jgi:hypothetical protein